MCKTMSQPNNIMYNLNKQTYMVVIFATDKKG